MLTMAILALLTIADAPNAASAPLAKADEGFMQCYEPNDVAKTCQSIAVYKRNGDGIWDNTAIVLLDPTRSITLETVTPVQVRNGAVCGYIRNNDVLMGKLRVSGKLLSDEKAAPILAKVAANMAPLMNKEICTEYLAGPRELIAKGKIEGGSPELPDQRVKWVMPSEGYTVAPSTTSNSVAG